jgi:ankyrin repeat protein
VKVIRLLAERRADINIRKAKYETTLHIHVAALFECVEIIRILLDKGMSVDLINAKDSTPLHVSVEYGNMEQRKILSKEVLI